MRSVAVGLMDRLKELGLNEYEARIYASLLREGPARASDLAVRAGVPRTKVYGAAKSLERKGLIEARGRPLTYAALDPEEALGKIVEEEERRARRLRRMLDELRRLMRSAGAGGQEGRYSIVTGSAIVERLAGLVSDASRSVHGMLDHWGTELATSVRDEIRAAALGGVEVRLVVEEPDGELGAGRELAEFARVSPRGGGWSAFTFDGRSALLLDSEAGLGILLELPVAVGALDLLFERLWGAGMPLDAFLELAGAGISGAAGLLGGERALYEGALEALLSGAGAEELASAADAAYSKFLGILPELDSEPLEAAIVVWGALLKGGRARGSASVRYDQLTRIMTIEYEGSSRVPPTPWFLAFLGYLRSKGIEPLVVHNSMEGGLSVLQLKLVPRAQPARAATRHRTRRKKSTEQSASGNVRPGRGPSVLRSKASVSATPAARAMTPAAASAGPLESSSEEAANE
ncbi:MAG: helix-turn-helix domain-containing protein [Nitrososphaeria archaeon]